MRILILILTTFVISACATANDPDLGNYPSTQQPNDSSIAAETAARM